MRSDMNRLGSHARGRDNNLNLLRFAAASVVLLSHCWPLTQGTPDNEPAMQLFGLELGRMAVWVFFAVSGFLVASSWERRPNVRAFFLARVRRIFPGLIVMLLGLVFILGPIVTTTSLHEYFTQRQTWSFLLFNATLYELRWDIPGVFNRAALNGSLWTLPVEVRCYLVLGLLGWAGALRRSLAYALVAIVLAVLAYTGWLNLNQAPLAFSFLAGVGAWKWRDRIALDGRLALAFLLTALFFMHRRAPLSMAMLVLALAYGSLYLAYIPAGAVRAFNRIGDYSYGIYIYAFPVQVTVHQLWPGLGVAGMFVVAMPITLVLAALSWTLVESPALHGRGVRSGFGRRRTVATKAIALSQSPALPPDRQPRV